MWSWALLHVLVVMMVNHALVLAQSSPDPSTSEDPSTEEPSTTEEPTTTTSQTTTTTTTTAAPQPNNRICPANSGMVDATRVMAKTAHNYRRGRLARGEVKNKAGRNLPAATNMLRMEYNCTLEASAAASARKCSPANSGALSNGVHENLHFFAKSQAGSEKDAIVVAVKQWWSQIRVTGGIGQGVTYTQYNVGKPTEWFIRMAWATTQHFGCAVASCDPNWSVVCHYQSGVSLSQKIYNAGPACSACPYDTVCNEDKLCQLISTF